jgi:hypothetical protein
MKQLRSAVATGSVSSILYFATLATAAQTQAAASLDIFSAFVMYLQR